jgi:cytochrome c-type biogenesis protein
MSDLQLSPLTLVLAIGAGLLSFASPCVLPLLPAYQGYMTGLSAEELREGQTGSARTRVLLHGGAFVLGLAVVFAVFGASASLLGRLFLQHQTLLSRLGGAVIVIFGLHVLGLLRVPVLYREKRLDLSATRQRGLPGAFLMGAAFGIGWTPCIGPFLAGILALASQEQTVGGGAVLLLAYAFGLGIPFVVAGLTLERAMGAIRGLRPRLALVEKLSGVLLIAMGLLVFNGDMASIAGWLTRTFGTGLAQ